MAIGVMGPPAKEHGKKGVDFALEPLESVCSWHFSQEKHDFDIYLPSTVKEQVSLVLSTRFDQVVWPHIHRK